ncbi:hypothetical protein FQZ97_1058710 [compost metagenome]
MRIRREQPHHRHRVDALTSGACLAIGEQLSTLVSGGKWLDHGQEPHETKDARIRLSAKAWKHRSGCALSCANTDAQGIESVHAQKRRSGNVEVKKGTDTALRFWAKSADADFRKGTKAGRFIVK